MRVTPADRERTFVWTSADRHVVRIGLIPAGSGDVEVGRTDAVRLQFAAMKSDYWPEPISMIVHSERHSWTIARSAAEVNVPLTFRAMPADYELTIDAQHMRTLRQRIRLSKELSTVQLSLVPLPFIRGKVIDRQTGAPLFGATVTVDDALKPAAISDSRGQFAVEADPDAWPATLHIASAGHATAHLQVPRTHTSVSLLDVLLGRGGSIDITLDRTAVEGNVRIELYPRRDKRRMNNLLGTRDAAAGVSTITFSDLEPGSYTIVVRGSAPTEQFSKDVEMRTAETSETAIVLRPMRLVMVSERGGDRLPHARIHLMHIDGAWDANIEGDAEGTADVPIWQAGSFLAWVSGASMSTPFSVSRRFEADAVLDWPIDIPTREVRGIVRNALTGDPVANANVYLKVSGENQFVAVVHSDERGRFVFSSPLSGLHEIAAAADRFVPSTPLRYRFADADGDRELELQLEPADEKTVMVTDAAGAPVEAAAVLDFEGEKLTGKRYTDAGGLVRVPTPPGARRRVFVIPRDGVLSVLTIGADGDPRVMVRVSAAAATLMVKTESTEHGPIPDVWLLVRFNGVMLPLELLQTLSEMHGSIPVSDRDGRAVLRNMPPGFYEIWPLGSPEEMRAVMAGGGSDALVKLQARTGMNEATLTFSAKP